MPAQHDRRRASGFEWDRKCHWKSCERDGASQDGAERPRGNLYKKARWQQPVVPEPRPPFICTFLSIFRACQKTSQLVSPSMILFGLRALPIGPIFRRKRKHTKQKPIGWCSFSDEFAVKLSDGFNLMAAINCPPGFLFRVKKCGS